MVLRSKQYKDKDKLRITRNEQRKRYYKKTQGNESRLWTDEEIKLILESKMTDMELAIIISRSVSSIQSKRYYYGNGSKQPLPRGEIMNKADFMARYYKDKGIV